MKIETIIDYSLIKDKQTFLQIVKNNKIKLKIFNIDKKYYPLIKKKSKKYINLPYKNLKQLESLKEYLAVLELTTNKKIDTSKYIYRLF